MSDPAVVLGIGLAALLNLSHHALIGWAVLSAVLAVASFGTAIVLYRKEKGE